MRTAALLTVLLVPLPVGTAWAQSSSLYLKAVERGRQAAEEAKGTLSPLGNETVEFDRVAPLNPELERVSLLAVQTKPPHKFRVQDLVTVIVREQKSYESDSTLKTRKDYQIESKIDEFLRTLNGHLAAASFTDGKPNIDFELDTKLNTKGDAERNDKLTFRITARVIDIKPNGLLVLEGKQRIRNDEEVQVMAFTGTCRSRDVTADNTILSTQIYDQVIDVQHEGAVRDASKRGWLLRILDFASPF